MDKSPHIPVLIKETIENLIIKKNGVYIDCTVGFGGHSKEIIKEIDDKGMLIGIDIDPYALEHTYINLFKHSRKNTLYQCNFINFPNILQKQGIKQIDGMIIDLGLSSYQVDSGHRGLSYRTNSKIDMRMDADLGLSAIEFINRSTESEIASVIKNYGQERYYKRISKNIKERAKKEKIETTFQLASIIKKSIGGHKNKSLSRVFQALRIHLNHELENIIKVLENAEKFLVQGGRVAIISFHSIEDRIAKIFFKESLYLEPLYKKVIKPNYSEIKINKRARSAKLRIGVRNNNV